MPLDVFLNDTGRLHLKLCNLVSSQVLNAIQSLTYHTHFEACADGGGILQKGEAGGCGRSGYLLMHFAT